jgi:tRNA-2-methylthio-N6-dimethylallyladenosine synthase
MKYYIWTIGCQMNRAESLEMANLLIRSGHEQVKTARQAEIAILNTCVVRQNAENKVNGMLGYIKGIKTLNPGLRIVVTGCFVEPETAALKKAFPYVDYFFPPGLSGQFEDWLSAQSLASRSDGFSISNRAGNSVVTYIPIIQGCNNYCSYCIVPYRRGSEKSRPPVDILDVAAAAVANGTREIILLGQNVNAYGHDLEQDIDLCRLLRLLHDIPDLLRIRFLTNHPKDMSDSLIEAMASLPKVCRHVCLPLQAGDDLILRAMNRHYTFDHYRSLIHEIRNKVPGIAISTDLIVGFPGETDEQFLNSVRAIEKLRFDVVHTAAYSPRLGTKAAVEFADDVTDEIKKQRLHRVESLQEAIATEINTGLTGTTMEVLVEGEKDSRWYGRTYSDKLVFFTGNHDLLGKLTKVEIVSASPWALRGQLITPKEARKQILI